MSASQAERPGLGIGEKGDRATSFSLLLQFTHGSLLEAVTHPATEGATVIIRSPAKQLDMFFLDTHWKEFLVFERGFLLGHETILAK